MFRRRFRQRVDDNQKTIVKALRQIPGVSVATGHDDILVGYRGRTWWFEIKREDKAARPSSKTPSQDSLIAKWQGQYHIVSDHSEIEAVIGIK